MKKKSTLNYYCNYGFFSKGLKNEFEAAAVNEPSVFEPLKFDCIFKVVKVNVQNINDVILTFISSDLKVYR